MLDPGSPPELGNRYPCLLFRPSNQPEGLCCGRFQRPDATGMIWGFPGGEGEEKGEGPGLREVRLWKNKGEERERSSKDRLVEAA